MEHLRQIGWLICFSAMLLTGCGEKHPMVQSRSLDSQSRVILKDAWVLNHSPRLLQVVVAFEGGNPVDTYEIRVRLRDREQGEFSRAWLKQFKVPSPDPNQRQVIWEFQGYPTESQKIYLQAEFFDKRTQQLVNTLQFSIPGVPHLYLRKMGSQ